MAALSKAWLCDRSLAGIVGSNTAGGMDVCCQTEKSLPRADYSSRGVLPSVKCLNVIVKRL